MPIVLGTIIFSGLIGPVFAKRAIDAELKSDKEKQKTSESQTKKDE